MIFRYETEYCLGGKTWVCHRYGGLQAIIAIAFDLALSLVFGLVGCTLRLVWFSVLMVWFVVTRAVWALAFLLSLPFRLMAAIFAPRTRRPTIKPAWVTLDEL